MTDYLDEIQARADAATDGPWRLARYSHGGGRVYFEDDSGRDLVADCYSEGDREFITHARTDVPRLIAAIRAVEAAARETPPDEVESSPEVAWVQGYNAAFTDVLTAIRDALAVTR